MIKISVIIPVYNTSKYVIKCLNSVVNQKIKDLEIIIVNDGSEDNSETLIKNWIENQNATTIKYLKKENGGLSEARNFGIQFANGKYLAFIDSDDYIDKELFGNIEKYIDDDIDLIKFKMKAVDGKGNIIKKMDGPIFEKCTGEEAFKKLCIEDKYIDPACIYLYKRDFFLAQKFKYQVGTYHEDFGLTPLIIVKAKSVVSTNEFGYNYLQRENSITNNEYFEKNVKKAKDSLKHYDNMIKLIEGYNVTEHTKNLIKRYYTNTIVLKAIQLVEDKTEFKNYIEELKKRKVYKNIKVTNLKQLIKKILLRFNINLYLKMR